MDHTFSICAYQESPYLENCIRSVLKQTEKSRVILCTSTPNDHIKMLCKKYDIPMYVREGKSDIRDDWNFAYEMAESKYVTIAHQDDIYHKNYVKKIAKYVEKYPDTIIAMTDYKIINEHNKARGDISLIVKMILKLPLRFPTFSDKEGVKLAVQSLGNAICCPSVCYHKELIQWQREVELAGDYVPLFQSELKYALDWETFYDLAKLAGRFTYVPEHLFYYRIHEEATSKKCLKDNRKTEEEILMFSKFWPEWVVKVLMRGYKLSYKSYE